MDSIAAHYASSDSEVESDESETSEEPPSKSPLARLPAEIAEKYRLQPSISKRSAMSARNLCRGLQSWSTFIYYEWRPGRLERMQLMRIVDDFNRFCRDNNAPLLKHLRFEPLHISSLGAPLSLHVSLSQSLSFESEAERDALFTSLNKKVRESARLNPFKLSFQPEFRILPSYAKDTLFLTVPVDPIVKTRQMKPINEALQDALSETFPKKSQEMVQRLTCMPATTHMSIAMATNAPKLALENLNLLNALLPQDETIAQIEIQVTHLRFDKNRQVLSIPLGS